MRSSWLSVLVCGCAVTGVGAAEPPERIVRAAAEIPGFGDPLAAQFEVKTVKNVPYRDDPRADEVRHKLDLYLPEGAKDYPVFFFVHGGAWRSGSKDLYGRIGELFAGNGVGTVVINYRLSPAVRHPAHITDVARAFAWTYRNIGDYGGNKDRIFAAGHSAGGHLVALLATDGSYLEAEKLTPEAIRGVIPMSGVYAVLPDLFLPSVFGDDSEVRKQAFPITHVVEQVRQVARRLPPFLVIYADRDLPLIDKMSQQFTLALRGAECDSAELEIAGRNHITLIMGLMVEKDPATQAILKFIREHAEVPPKAEK